MSGPWEKYQPQGIQRSKGVQDNGMLPGGEGNLDRSKAGDDWTTVELSEDGIPKHYVLPTQRGDKPPSGDGISMGDAVDRFLKTKQHYGAFDTDEDGAAFMKGGAAPSSDGPWTKYAPAEAAPQASASKTGHTLFDDVPADVVPQLPPQYRAYQSMMKSRAQIDAMPQNGRTIMALPFAAIPGGIAMQGATGAIAGAITDPENPIRGAGIGAFTGFGGALIGKAAGAAGGAVKNVATNAIASKMLPAGQAAEQILGRALERDRISPEQASQTAGRYSDKDIAVMDTGGANTARLARNVRTMGGEGGEQIDRFLAERQADQHARVLSDIRQNLADGSDAHGITQGLLAQRATTAKPLYDEAFKANQNIASPEIDHILETPAGKQALSEARVLMQNDRSLMGVPDAELRDQAMEAGQEVPKGGIASGLKLRTLHYVKMALDDQVGAAIRTGETTRARILTGLKNDFVRAIDEADVTAKAGPNSTKAAGGLYKQARAAFSGPSQSMEAIDAGGDFLKMRPEEIKAHLADLGESDQDFYRVGAARALQDRVLKAGDNLDAVSRVFGNKNLRSQIETVFGKGAASKFAEAMTAEKMATATNRFVRGGSQTADKAADISDGGDVLNDAVHGAIHGGIRGAIMHPAVNALRAHSNAFFNGMTPEVRNALARLLVQTGEGRINGLTSRGQLPATAIDNWGNALAPFIATETGKGRSFP